MLEFDRNLISGFEDIKCFEWQRRKIIRIPHQSESESCLTADAAVDNIMINLRVAVMTPPNPKANPVILLMPLTRTLTYVDAHHWNYTGKHLPPRRRRQEATSDSRHCFLHSQDSPDTKLRPMRFCKTNSNDAF